MEDQQLFDSNISFYSELFELDIQEKETFEKLSKQIINLLSESEVNDLDNPLIQECIYKSAIFCIQANKNLFIKLSKEEHIKNIKNYALKTKSDIQKNFKDINRISTILTNIKDFIKQLSNSEEDITKYPLEILNNIMMMKNFKRKLDEFHNSFFDSTDLSFLFKKLIWNIFICLVNENELKSSTLYKTKIFFAVWNDILLRIPNKFYPTRLGNEMKDISSKKNIIQEYFKQYTSGDIYDEEILANIKKLYSKINIFNEEITLKGEDLCTKEKIEDIINKLFDYYNKNILNLLNFDHRALLLNEENTSNSPKKNNNFYKNLENNNLTQMRKSSFTCNRELFKEEKEEKRPRKVSFSFKNNALDLNNKNFSNERESILMMTTITRVWNLLSWAQGALKNYDEAYNYIKGLQQNYKPNYLKEEEYNKYIPIENYANEYMKELKKLLIKYRVKSNFEIDLIHLYIYCLYLIIKNDTTVFSENFSALLLYNDDFIKASVALSFELALTIFDISEIGLNSIYEQLNLDVYDFWKVILPSNINLYHVELQKHLEEIDYQLSTFLIWRNPSDKFKNELKEFLENENIIENENEKDSIFKLIRHESFQQSAFLCHDKRDFEIPFINEKFKTNSTNKLIFKDCYEYVENYNKIIGIGVLLQRLIVYCITLNKFIFDNFSNETIESKDSLTKPIEIDEYIRKESELIIKVILTNYNDISILWGLHIDQFVLSCILLVLDKHNLFNFPGQKNINWNNESNNVKINKNILHNSYNKSKFSIEQVNEDSHIFYHVKFSNQKFVNIFEFYHDKFKITFINYFNDINNIKIKTKIDYFNVQKDLDILLQLKNSKNHNTNSNIEDTNNDDDEFANLEKPTKKLKVSEDKYIIFANNEKIGINNKNTSSNGNISNTNFVFNSPISKNNNKNNNRKMSIPFNSQNNSNNIEDLISLLKKLNIKNNNPLYFNLLNKEGKYSAYRNDNLKLIYNNIIKSELPRNEGNKINKEKLNKLKEFIKSQN